MPLNELNTADDFATGLPPEPTIGAAIDEVNTWAERHTDYGLDVYTDVNAYRELVVRFRDADSGILVREVIGLSEFREYTNLLEAIVAA